MYRPLEIYAEKRFRAHVNLLRILSKQNLIPPPELNMNPQNVEQYKQMWGIKINAVSKTAIFERDAHPIEWIDAATGIRLLIVFLHVESKSENVTDKHLNDTLKPLLLERDVNREITDAARSRVNTNVQAILLTDGNLAGAARNQLIDFNTVMQRGIRHFTTDELQFDPTDHITQPIMTVASPQEITAFIESQRDLLIGRRRLAHDLEEQVNNADDDEEKIEIIRQARAEILSKLPTLNSNDPMVKWNGYRVGDIIKVTRRSGKSRFVYRRVILNLQSVV